MGVGHTGCQGDDANCDDQNPCTQDTCDAVLGCISVAQPRTGCRQTDKALILLKDVARDSKDKVQARSGHCRKIISSLLRPAS